jgi:ring-1,2-phenylacetyl-CoA epoxidase subunit PaaE
MPEMYPLMISKISRNTPNAVLISFRVPEEEKEKFQFEAGQYLTLETKINEKLVRRSYSICSGVDEGLQVGIKEVTDGVFSTHANRSMHEDDHIMVAPPQGRFQYVSSTQAQSLAGFAAGSGITPIMSILKTALLDHPDNRFHLVYGNKTPEDSMFFDELKGLEKEFEGRLSIQWVFSRANLAGSLFGRVEASVTKSALKQMGEVADKFYLCGPESMIETVSETLSTNGVEEEAILFELFSASTQTDQIEGKTEGASLEIIYDELTHKIENTEGKSVLDAALQNKLDVPYSCQGGVCSSCIARVKSGTAEMVTNQILTDEEVEEGLVLTCQAHATSNHLVVDYDDV